MSDTSCPPTGGTCVITGPTSGIGKSTALALARSGMHLVLLCRSREKGEHLRQEILHCGGRADVVSVDLSSLQSVEQAASHLLDAYASVDVLINNAGVINTDRRLTVDGLEEMFAVNHLAHFLLTRRLLPRLQSAAQGRIVHVSSGAHAFVRGFDVSDYNWTQRKYRTFQAYGHSKLANLLFSHALSKRLSGSTVTSNALHPGAVFTGLGMNNGPLGRFAMWLASPFFLTPDEGARTSVFLAENPEIQQVSGRYFHRCKSIDPKPWARDDAAAESLWALSEQLLQARDITL